MSKSKLYAVVYRFHKPQRDGAYGVAVLDRPKGWKPIQKQREKLDSLCNEACDMIEDGIVPPGHVATFYDGAEPRKRQLEKDEHHANALIDQAQAGNRFCVGLFPDYSAHPQHETMQ